MASRLLIQICPLMLMPEVILLNPFLKSLLNGLQRSQVKIPAPELGQGEYLAQQLLYHLSLKCHGEFPPLSHDQLLSPLHLAF